MARRTGSACSSKCFLLFRLFRMARGRLEKYGKTHLPYQGRRRCFPGARHVFRFGDPIERAKTNCKIQFLSFLNRRPTSPFVTWLKRQKLFQLKATGGWGRFQGGLKRRVPGVFLWAVGDSANSNLANVDCCRWQSRESDTGRPNKDRNKQDSFHEARKNVGRPALMTTHQPEFRNP